LTIITSNPRLTNPSEISATGVVEIGRYRVTVFITYGLWDTR
jgi:hypothetical protein